MRHRYLSVHGVLHASVSMAALGALGALGAIATPAYAQSAASSAADEQSSDDTIVVTGQRAALRSAQAIKRNADEIVDSIVAEDIGKLPDRSVTEVLQRVVGITIDHTYRDIGGNTDPEHFAVEGAGVAIRGLSYVRSEINGRDSFTANGGRSLSFDDVSPELMAGVDVYKNPSAEQIEGAVGGLVNLRTAKPFDLDGARISVSTQASWGDLNNNVSPKPSASVLLSDRWHTGIGDIGILVDFAHSESATRTDGIELFADYPRISSLEPGSTWIPPGTTAWIPNGGPSWRTLAFDRKRDGQYVALQWRPSDNLETSLTFFRSQYQFHWDENAIFQQSNPYNIQPAPGTTFTLDSNNIVVAGTFVDTVDGGMPFGADTRSADRRSVTTDISWNTRWDVNDRLTLRSDLQYVRGTTKSDDFTVATNVNIPSETFDARDTIPTASVDQNYMSDPNNYYWSFTMDGLSRAVGSEWSWRGDADYTIGDGFFKSIRAGVRATERDALTQVSQPGNGYNWAAVSQTWQLGWYIPNLAYLSQFSAPYQVYTFPNFYNGSQGAPANVVVPATSLATGWPTTFATLQNFQTILCQQLNPSCVNGWRPAALSDTAGTNTQDERTYAAYVVTRFGTESGPLPFDGNIGVRVVRTQDTAHGYFGVTHTDVPAGAPGGGYVLFTDSQTPIDAENTYTDVLPSLNLRFHLTDELQARFAVAKAIARPDFSQLQAATNVSAPINNTTFVQTFTGTASGNPDLRPTKSTQIDATLEWYFAPTGSLTAAVFYKDLSDVVINQIFNATALDSNGDSHTFTTTGPINGANGTIKGIEVAYQQYYDFLPGPLAGFGLQANFTYVDSQRDLYNPVTGAYCNSSDSQATSLNVNLNGCDTDGRTFGNLPLQGLSKYAYNVALLYDRGPISARLAYSWRSKNLMGVNVNSANGGNATNTDPSSPNYGAQNLAFGLPLYAADYGTLDGSIFYKFNDRLTFGLEGRNLTDAVYEELAQQHIGTHGVAWYKSGRSFTVQMRATF